MPAFSHPQYLKAIRDSWASEMLTPGCSTCHGDNGRNKKELGSLGQAMQAVLGQRNAKNPAMLRDAVFKIERLECESGKTFRDFFTKDFRFPPFNCSQVTHEVLEALRHSKPSEERHGIPDDVWEEWVENYYKNPPPSEATLERLKMENCLARISLGGEVTQQMVEFCQASVNQPSGL